MQQFHTKFCLGCESGTWVDVPSASAGAELVRVWPVLNACGILHAGVRSRASGPRAPPSVHRVRWT